MIFPAQVCQEDTTFLSLTGISTMLMDGPLSSSLRIYGTKIHKKYVLGRENSHIQMNEKGTIIL